MSKQALIHSTVCGELLDEGLLDNALAYCVAQGIAPPFSPCVEHSPDYAQCVELAQQTLCDYGWWEKRLKLQAARLSNAREADGLQKD